MPNDRQTWILDRVEIRPNGCWDWQRACNDRGYGVTKAPWATISTSAYRAAYEAFIGDVPDGLVLHHECRNGRCVNPDHVRPVTQQENVLVGLMDRGVWPCSHICRVCRQTVEAAGHIHSACGVQERVPLRRGRIVDAMRRYFEAYGEAPSAVAWNVAMARKLGRDDLVERYESGDWPPTSQVQKVFGSWAAALDAAGFNPHLVGEPAHRRRRPFKTKSSPSVGTVVVAATGGEVSPASLGAPVLGGVVAEQVSREAVAPSATYEQLVIA